MFHPIGWCSTMFHDVPRHLSILIFYNIFLIIFYSCEMLWRDMKGFLRSLSKEWRSSLQAPLIYWRVGWARSIVQNAWNRSTIVWPKWTNARNVFSQFSQCLRRRVQSNSVALPHGIQSVVPRSMSSWKMTTVTTSHIRIIRQSWDILFVWTVVTV